MSRYKWSQSVSNLQFLPFMFSSNSSGFDKELASTRVYDFEQSVGEANVELVQTFDEYDLQQSCLLRLKAQREKIQELTKLYQEKQKELSTRSEHQKKLEEEVERLSDMTEYKKCFNELKRDHDSLLQKAEVAEEEYQSLKREFDLALQTTQQKEEALKAEIKLQKEQRVLAETNWEAIVMDRQEQLRKQTRKAQQRDVQLSDKINKLEQQLQSLTQSMNEQGTQLESTSFKLRGQLKVKDEEIVSYDKLVECMRKQLSEFKNRMISSENEWEKEKDELLEMVEQMRTQIKLLRRDQSEKENQIYEVKEILRRCDIKNQNLEETVSSLKSNMKKVKDSSANQIRQLSSSSDESKGKFQLWVQELKGQLERQMQEKGTLALQVRRLRGCLERKEQQEKQRKMLLMSEFREIDKLERVVKRVI